MFLSFLNFFIINLWLCSSLKFYDLFDSYKYSIYFQLLPHGETTFLSLKKPCGIVMVLDMLSIVLDLLFPFPGLLSPFLISYSSSFAN